MAFFMNSGGRSEVASVQYGSITVTAPATTGTATITSVDTTRSVVVALGSSTNGPIGSNEALISVALTNSTTVTATKGGGGTYSATINFMVITFNAGTVKSLQDVEITGADTSLTDTATITSVNTSKTALFVRSGFVSPSANPNATSLSDEATRVMLTNATTLTKVRWTAPPNGRFHLHVTVCEFN